MFYKDCLKTGISVVLSVLIFACSKKTLSPEGLKKVPLNEIKILVSNFYNEFGKGNLYDNSFATVWNAGGYAPQWVEFEFLEQRAISEVTLCVEQTPFGESEHVISFAGEDKKYFEVGRIRQMTKGGDILSFKNSGKYESAKIKYLKIETIKSPSWVAWKEIEISPQVNGLL